MAKEIRVSPTTRIVRAYQLRLSSAKAGAPIDFSREHLVILDDDGRPVAECWPVEREPGQPAPASSVSARPPGPPPGTFTPAIHTGAKLKGALLHVHQVILEKLWADNPHARPDVIASKFELQTGRGVTVETATHYRPKAGAAG